MLSIDIVCIGKLNQKFYSEGCAEYLKRLSAFAKVGVSELSEVKMDGEGAAAERRVIEAESKKILDYVGRKRTVMVVMCIEGRQVSSVEFSQFFEKTAMMSSDITFVIGGSLGLSEELKSKAALKMSMSEMTFPHQLARLMLLEQIYRACTINANIKYHK
ncbi:MAG: 23S rRNA (pseudouridine(1915)-N(3))-methyltransferase RlmH [Oscillospiraceae bacterium]